MLEMASNFLNADDIKDTIAGALSSVLSQVTSGRGGNANENSGPPSNLSGHGVGRRNSTTNSSGSRHGSDQLASHSNQENDDDELVPPPYLPPADIYSTWPGY